MDPHRLLHITFFEKYIQIECLPLVKSPHHDIDAAVAVKGWIYLLSVRTIYFSPLTVHSLNAFWDRLPFAFGPCRCRCSHDMGDLWCWLHALKIKPLIRKSLFCLRSALLMTSLALIAPWIYFTQGGTNPNRSYRNTELQSQIFAVRPLVELKQTVFFNKLRLFTSRESLPLLSK